MALFSGLVRFQFFSRGNPKTIVINLQTPTGTSLEKTDELVTKIEDNIIQIPEKADIEAVVSTIGQYTENWRNQVDTRNATVKIDLVELDNMQFTHDQIKNSIRKYLDKLTRFVHLPFQRRRRWRTSYW